MNVWTIITPWVSQGFRDLLRTVVGPWIVANGIASGSNEQALLGAFITIGGVLWGWWTTKGANQVVELLKKMTASQSHAEAVEKATVLPAPSVAAVTAAVTKAATGIATVLLIAFALSFLVAVPAMAQVKLVKPTGNIANDIAAATGQPAKPPLLTGNVEKDLQALWQKIVSASLADLNYAAAMASNANTTTSAVRLQCLKAIITLNEQASGANLKNADGTPMAKPDPHLFTDVESLAEIIDNLAPQGPLFVSCAGAAQLAKTNVLTFVNAVVTGAAGFAAMPVIPGL